MIRLLEELNRRLSEKNLYGEIIIVGGAALALAFDARDSTRDIDCIFEPSPPIREIISDMEKEYHLPKDWLNDGVKGFITKKMNFDVYSEDSNLKVSTLDAEGLLAMKLTSARTDTKDMQDSLFLMKKLKIKAESELFDIIQKYTNPQMQTAKVKFFTMEAFAQHIQKEKLADRPMEKNNPKSKKSYFTPNSKKPTSNKKSYYNDR